jgi:hypothetical protein
MDRASARDAINTFSTEQFRAVTTALLGEPGELRYQGVRPAEGQPLVPPDDRYWARVTMQVADERQETLRCEVRRFVSVS